MCEMIGQFGIRYKPPSYYDIRDKHLKKIVEATHNILEEHKVTWKNIWCTIMSRKSKTQLVRAFD